MVSSSQIFGHFSANRHGARYGRFGMLCVFANKAKLSYCAFDLAYGYGHEYTMPFAQQQVFSAEMLAFNVCTVQLQILFISKLN